MSYKQIVSQILCLFLFCTFLACVDASNSVSSNITLPPVDDFPAATPEHVGLDSQKLNALSQMIAAGDYGMHVDEFAEVLRK